ncbi:hypothetical protein [Morganella psychrotolerans]|uniref:hypothetical protein n=1 Tax=Morganella psychrotolerans TaxID=368603 RepID=UPI0039B0D617
MNVQFDIDDVIFNDDKKEIFKKVLRLNDTDMQVALNKAGKAALCEYLKMIVEGGMPGRADEMKQDRLLYLIQNYFGNTLPTEMQISTIFQLTQSQSTTLLKNTVSRFRQKLEHIITSTMKQVIELAVYSEPSYLVVINSDVVRDELNMLITQNEPTFNPIARKKGSAGQFVISEDSYRLLRRELDLNEAG